MKVLNILRKAGLIAVEEAGTESASKAASEKAPSTPGRDRGRAGGKADPRRKGDEETESGRKSRNAPAGDPAQGTALTPPPPPTEAEIAPIAASELVVDLDRIFEALKLPVHAHGWTVDRVARALESEHFRALAEPTQRAALLAMLDASGAPIADVIDDAVRRDQALDAYAAFARKKLGDRLAEVQKAIADQEAAIATARQMITGLEEGRSGEQAAFAAWMERKTGKEEEYARVVALLTNERVISVGGSEATSPDEAGQRPESSPPKEGPK